MLSPQVMGKLRQLASEVSDREGVQLYDVEFVGKGNGRTLRVFVSKPDQSPSIDDCANVSRGLSLLLDVEDLIPGEKYSLEVSTPGLNRQLTQDWHYKEAIGERVKVRTREAIPGTEERKVPLKQIKGELKAFDNNELTVMAEEVEWKVPLDIVHRSNVVYEFEQPKKPKGNKSKR